MRTFSKSESSDYELAPEGTYPAVLVGWAELGNQNTPYGTKPQIGLVWELSETGSDGRALSVTEVLTASFNERARLYQRVVALCGGREPPSGFDLTGLLGRGVILTTAHVSRGERVYCNITACGPLPKGLSAPTPSVRPLWYETSHHDEATFAALPSRFRRLIEGAETGGYEGGQAARPPAPPAAPAGYAYPPQPPAPQPARPAAAPAPGQGWVNQPPPPPGPDYGPDIPF